MGSVIDFIECPRCKSEDCFDDYYYKTGEEYISCPDCGYNRSSFIKRDDEGNMFKIDEDRDFAIDNVVREETLLEEPYCAFMIRYEDGVGSGGAIPTKEEYDIFVSDIVSMTNQPDHKMEEVTISRFVDGEIKKETIWEQTKK
jgi:Zn ribbon nucleic-acid-binding protein